MVNLRKAAVLGLMIAGANFPLFSIAATTTAARSIPKPRADEESIVGRWIDPILGALVVIKRAGNGYVMLQEPNNTAPYTIPVRIHPGSKGKRFDAIKSDFGDNFVVRADGRLDMRDKDGSARILEAMPSTASNTDARTVAVNQAQQTLRCQHDLDCTLGDKLQQAVDLCQRAIQSRSRWDFKWAADEPAFAGYRWNPKAPVEKGLVDFFGDRLQLQNGFGAWMNYRYVCTFDTRAGSVARVSMEPGHYPH